MALTSNSESKGFGRLLAAAALPLFERSEFGKAPKTCELNLISQPFHEWQLTAGANRLNPRLRRLPLNRHKKTALALMPG